MPTAAKSWAIILLLMFFFFFALLLGLNSMDTVENRELVLLVLLFWTRCAPLRALTSIVADQEPHLLAIVTSWNRPV